MSSPSGIHTIARGAGVLLDSVIDYYSVERLSRRDPSLLDLAVMVTQCCYWNGLLCCVECCIDGLENCSACLKAVEDCPYVRSVERRMFRESQSQASRHYAVRQIQLGKKD